MRHLYLSACAVFMLGATILAQPVPATAPGAETLIQGQITYHPPAEWKSLGKRPDDRSVGYSMGGDQAEIVITVAPQPAAIPRSLGPRLFEQVDKAIRADAQRGNIEIVSQPASEADERFLLRVRDRYRTRGRFVDRVQLYQGVGKNLVSVVIRANTEDEQQARDVHAIGEQVMLGIRLTRPAGPTDADILNQDLPIGRDVKPSGTTTRPVVFPEPRLRVPPPGGWKAEPTGKPTGLIVVWRDPDDPSNLITLTYRPIPAEARNDSTLRNMAIERIAAGENPTFRMEGAAQVGDVATVTDKRFIRKTRAVYKSKEAQVVVGFRQVRAGDGVASITSVALHDKSDAIETLADTVAAGVRSTGGS
jgi:hypothetical protein